MGSDFQGSQASLSSQAPSMMSHLPSVLQGDSPTRILVWTFDHCLEAVLPLASMRCQRLSATMGLPQCCGALCRPAGHVLGRLPRFRGCSAGKGECTLRGPHVCWDRQG